MRRGDPTGDMYVVQQGRCLVYDESDMTYPIAVVGPGAVLGDIALLLDCPRGNTIVTETEVVLWALDEVTR